MSSKRKSASAQVPQQVSPQPSLQPSTSGERAASPADGEIRLGILTRDFGRAELTLSREADTGPLRLSFPASSEEPVDRWFGREVLSHAADAVVLDRVAAGAAALLFNHDWDDPIGMVDGARVVDGRLWIDAHLFATARAAEVATMIEGGLRNVSIGYGIEEVLDDSKAGTMTATRWEPHEVSIVTVPATFAGVGIGRAADDDAKPVRVLRAVRAQEPTNPPAAMAAAQPRESTVTQEANAAAGTNAEVRAEPHVEIVADNSRPTLAQMEQARQTGIRNLCKVGKLDESFARRLIEAGTSIEDAAHEMTQALAERSTNTHQEAVAMAPKEVKQYSYVRAIRAALDRAEGRAVSGFEVEVSQDLERAMPASYKGNGGIFVPLSLQRTAISEALYNTSGKGASTVFTQPGEFIELLRNEAVSVQLGARVLTGLQGPVSFPTQTAAATMYWMPENDGTDVTASNATLGSVGLTPKTLQGTTAFSRQLMAQSSIDVEAFIRADLAAGHALAWDRAVIHGAGSGNEPTGIYAASNVNSVAMGGVPTFGKLVDMVTEVLKDNALAGSLAFATTPGMAGKLAQTVVAASTDTRMIWSGKLNDGELAGYMAKATNQVLATLGGGSEHGIVFGNWADALIGVWGAGLEIIVDPYRLKKQGMIEVTSFQMVDIALRHPQSFCKATGATIS